MGAVTWIVDALNAIPLAGLMLVVTLGWSLGRVSVRDVELGPGGATIVVALALGWLGLHAGRRLSIADSEVSLGLLGFALFLYSVGFDAAPHFFPAVRRRRGLQFIAVAAVVNGVALLGTLAIGRLLDLDASSAAGLLAGALTSATTFAAASEVTPSDAGLAVAFAMTYPVGLIGVIALIQVVPRLLGSDLSEDVSDDAAAADASGSWPRRSSGDSIEVTRAFEVRVSDVAGQRLRDLDLPRRTGCVISRIRQGGEVVIPTAETVLELGDRLMATGRVDELREFARRVGPEVPNRDFARGELPTRRIAVRRSSAIGRTLAELELLRRFHCVVTRVERGALWIEPDADVSLVRHDVLEVVGRRRDLRALARELGHFAQPVTETDVAVYAGGILLGLVIGSIHVPAFGVVLSIGMAGGLLVTGLALGSVERLGPIRTHVPAQARQLVRDLGVLLFVGETGLLAGHVLRGGLSAHAGELLLAALAVNVVTVLVALGVARGVLRMRAVDAWGSLSGGLTSTAALHAVRRAADSNEPAIAYATAYAVGSVLATVAGPVVVLAMGG